MNMIWRSTALSVILLLLGTSIGKADDLDSGISVSAESVIEVNPEKMRLKVDILFKGKDLPEALAKRKARQLQLEKQLVVLGATKESIKLSDPVIDESQGQDQAQISRMMNRMSGRRGRKPVEELAKVTTAKVQSELTAEWPLKFSDQADLLVQVAKLQEAIKAADLGGLRNKEESDAEEEELTEEMEGIQEMYGNQDRPKPGAPSFLFVAQISVAQREKALGEAFRNAKQQATQLSKAADIELGPVRNLKAAAVDGLDNEGLRAGYYGSYYQNRIDARDDEASAPVAATLKKRVFLQATFSMASKLVPVGDVSKP